MEVDTQYLKKKTHRMVLTGDHEPQEMMDAGKTPERTHAKTQRRNTEKHRGPVNPGTASVCRQAVGSHGERRKQSGEITVKSSPAPNRIHKF